MIRHVLFDCFGTLLDTGGGSIDAVKQILAGVGSNTDAEMFYARWKRIKKEMMRSPEFVCEKKLFELSLAKVFSEYGINADAAEAVKPMTASLFAERKAFPDVFPALRRLSALELDIAIGSTTDTDSLMYYLKQNGLEFEYIFTSEGLRAYKPDGRFYAGILERTGWDAGKCLFIGDSYDDDVFGPKAAGMKAVLLDRKGHSDSSSLVPAPDMIICSLNELTEREIKAL